MRRVRLGVNIDHVATIRNARGGTHPDPLHAALLAVEAGADGITAHLREDRRHITDTDIAALKDQLSVPLNLEMAATEEMLSIALRHKPHAVCLVPEKREERTTEGGLDVVAQETPLREFIKPLTQAGIRISLFIAPDANAVEAAKRIGAPVIELHTGAYCENPSEEEFNRLREAAASAGALGLECHAGHGLNYETAAKLATFPEIAELNIGHFLIGEAIYLGLPEAIQRMRMAMEEPE
jgi:pyridoxine 5-phosphate synthase